MSAPDEKDQRRSDAVLVRGAKAHMAEAVAQRNDDVLHLGWRAFLPLIGSLLGVVVFILLIFWLGALPGIPAGYFFLYTLVSAFVALLDYQLLRTLATHVRREAMMRRAALEYIRATASSAGKSSELEVEISNLESIERDAASTEKLPSSLYTAFGALPLVGIFVTLYYLRALEMVPAAHEKRWSAFVQQVSSAATKLGLAPRIKATTAEHRNRFAMLAIATIVFPPVVIVWYDRLLKQRRAHVESQAADEDAIVQLLS